MANVSIYAEHRDILDELISSAKVSSAAAAAKTGPFRDQRDAYVFAASLALALGAPQAEADMPTTRKDITTIRDSVFLGAAGAEELTFMVVLTSFSTMSDNVEPRSELVRQLDLINEENLADRLAVLDRYAYAGFEWLRKYRKDEATVRDLLLVALAEVTCVPSKQLDISEIRDPLLELLL